MSGDLLPVLHLALTAAYAGFQWRVRGLVHPQFGEVPVEAFGRYERRHQQRIGRVVDSLFAGRLATSAWLPAARPEGVALPAVVTGGAFRRLLRIDTLRAVAATAGAAAAVWVVLPLA